MKNEKKNKMNNSVLWQNTESDRRRLNYVFKRKSLT